MKQAYKKRSHEATANSPPVLSDMGKLLYKSGKFQDNHENIFNTVEYALLYLLLYNKFIQVLFELFPIR